MEVKFYCFCEKDKGIKGIKEVYCNNCFKNSFFFNLLKRSVNSEIRNFDPKSKEIVELVEGKFMLKYSSYFKGSFGIIFSQELFHIYKENRLEVRQRGKSFFKVQQNFYRFLFTERISLLMTELYHPGTNEKPDMLGITKTLFEKFPQEFPSLEHLNCFVMKLNRELSKVYSVFGAQMKKDTEKEIPNKEVLQSGKIEMSNIDMIDLILNLQEMYIEEVKEIADKVDDKDDVEDDKDDGKSGKDDGKDDKVEDDEDDSNYNDLGAMSEEDEESPSNRENNSIDDQLQISLDDFLSNCDWKTPCKENNTDINFTLNGLNFTNTTPIFKPTNTDTTSISNKRRIDDKPQKSKKRLKFPRARIQKLQFDEITKKKITKVFQFMGLNCDDFPNHIKHVKEKYNLFFQSFIKLIFKGDVQLFCESLLSSTPIVVDHIEKIFENFSLDVKKTKLTIVEARKLEQKEKKEKQNGIIKELAVVNVSERNKDIIFLIIRKYLPEISKYLLLSKARLVRMNSFQFEPFPKILLEKDFILDKTVLEIFIREAASVQIITSSSFSLMLKPVNNQYNVTTQLELLEKNKSAYNFDRSLETEKYKNDINQMINLKEVLEEPTKLILLQTNFTILSLSEYTKQEGKYNIGFECFLDEEGIMKNRSEGNYFFKFEYTMQTFIDEFKHDEPATIREKKDFEFLKNYTLTRKDFDNSAWKDKWDNVFFAGIVNRQLTKHLVNVVGIPLLIDTTNLSDRTLLVVSRDKIEHIARFDVKNLTSRIGILGLDYEMNRIEFKENSFINYYIPEGIQIHPENLSKDSIVYVHLRASKLGKQIKTNFEEKLSNYLPDIKIVDTIHKQVVMKERNGQIKLKNGKACYRKALDEEKANSLSHIIVFQKDQIKFINDLVEKNKITLLLHDSIDFDKLRQEHYPQQENQLERNLLNFSRINREQQIEVLNRLVKSIRTDENEIFCRITHPLFFLIDIFKKIYPFFKPEYKVNKVLRVIFQDHADHTKNSCGVRNENIILCFDGSRMTDKAKEICNKYQNWGSFLVPDKKECTEKIGFLKGILFADAVSFPISFEDKVIYFVWGKTTGDNKDQLAQINKWRKHRRCPNCNKDYHNCNTNREFFSFADFCKCERNTLATCLKIFLDALNQGKSWEEAAFIASEDGYMGAPSHMVVGFFYRLRQIYKNNSREDIEKHTLSLLNDVLQITDILHDGFGVSGLFCRSFLNNSWLDKEKFDEFCILLIGKSISDFMGGHFRKLLMNCDLFLEKIVVDGNINLDSYCVADSLGEIQTQLMKMIFYSWREIYFFSYQSSLQSIDHFQFYFHTLLFSLSASLQKLPDSFNIRKTYTHGIFHYPDLWTITDLVNGCSESGENVNYRMTVAARLSSHYSQNIFKKFKVSEQYSFHKQEEEKKKSKIEKLQNELKKFAAKHTFQEIELEFPVDDEDFNAFYNLAKNYEDKGFYTCEQVGEKYIFKTTVSQKINEDI